MMIYLFGDLRQLRSFELVKPAISNPRAIARARPRLRSFFTKTGEEEKPSVKEKNVPSEKNHHPNGAANPQRKADQKNNNNIINDKDIPDNHDHGPHHQPVVVPQASLPAGNNGPSSPPSALVLPVTATDAPIVKLGFSVGNKGDEKAKEEEDGLATNMMSPTQQRKEGGNPTGDHKLPLQLSTILSLSPIPESPLSISASVSPASSVGDFKEKKPHLDLPVASSTSLQSNVPTTPTIDLVDSESDESGSSSDHGIVISPAFQTSVRYEHQDEWMWESGNGGGGNGWNGGEKEKSQKETWTTSRNTSASSPGSRVMSAFSSVIQWATSGVSSSVGRRVNSGATTGGGSAVSTTSCNNDKADTSVSVPGGTQDSVNDEKARITSSSPTTPVAILDAAASTTPTRPISHAGTFGVRSWIGGANHDDKNVPHSRRSSTRSASARPSSWDRRVSSRASRWSRGFGFNFGLAHGVHSVPEEGVYEDDPEHGVMSASVHARTCATCPAEGYSCEIETNTDAYAYGVESSSSSTFHARSVSQAQTIESFYAPPRDRASIFGTSELVHHHHHPNAPAGTILADQCTASFIPREYAAEVLPDLESVPRVSLSMSRASGERDVIVKEKDTNPNPGPESTKVSSPPRVPPRAPIFDFQGLPGLQFEDEKAIDEDEDEDGNKENIPVEPITPLRPARPRPPRLQLHTPTSAPALVVAASSSTPIGASRAIPPISPALPSSQFTHSVIPGYHHATAAAIANVNTVSSPSPSSSMPLPLPLKTKSSKFWFDTCPRHPAVEAKIAEAAALEEQKKRNAALLPPPTPHSPVSFWSSSASASAPSTFRNLPKDGGGGGATYPYPYASPSHHNRAWTYKMKDTIRNITTRSRSGTPLSSSSSSIPPAPVVAAPSTRPSSAQLSSNFLLSSNDSEDSSSSDDHWRSRLKSVMSVPAFGPLTRVLSPLVSRGQWEIVVRSAVYAFLSVWIWLGVIVSLPVLHVR